MTGFLIGAAVVSVLAAFAGGFYVGAHFGGVGVGRLEILKRQARRSLEGLEGKVRVEKLALKTWADKERIELVKKAAEAAGVNIQVL